MTMSDMGASWGVVKFALRNESANYAPLGCSAANNEL
jgi:hypothetical protein